MHTEAEIEINFTKLTGIEDDYREVTFTGNASWENDSFTHEFGTEKFESYLMVEDIKWDKSLYSEAENTFIQAYHDNNDNWNSIHKQLADNV